MKKLANLLIPQPHFSTEAGKEYFKLKILLEELDKKQLNEEVFDSVASEIKQLSISSNIETGQISKLKKCHANILKIVQKKLQLVPEKYYQNLWMVLGMSSFGLPLGVVYGLLMDNMAFLGLGMPIGIAFGIFLGKALDDKAKKQGKVLYLNSKLKEEKV